MRMQTPAGVQDVLCYDRVKCASSAPDVAKTNGAARFDLVAIHREGTNEKEKAD
jgi:hypothetical protein